MRGIAVVILVASAFGAWAAHWPAPARAQSVGPYLQLAQSDQQGFGDEPVPPQGAVLYEEDPTDKNGRRYDGTVAWRAEPDGAFGELSIQGTVDIPDHDFALTLTIRRNRDAPLAASEVIEVAFNLPPGFHGGVKTVAGVVMRSSAQQPKALIGRADKTGDGLFRVVLSNDASERAANLQRLRDEPSFHIPIIYADGLRAVVALSKGATGEDAFARAIATWN